MRMFDVEGADVRLWESVFSASQAATLLAALESEVTWRQDEIRIAGRQIPIPRLQAWVGDRDAVYTYSGLRLIPQPWTAAVRRIRARIDGLADHDGFNGALLSLYRSGDDSIGWHGDTEPELGDDPIIAVVSLGAERCIDLGARRDKRAPRLRIPLSQGSVLWMGRGTQRNYRHRIAKVAASKQSGPRISLSFRRVYASNASVG